jgi:hypothetical protein
MKGKSDTLMWVLAIGAILVIAGVIPLDGLSTFSAAGSGSEDAKETASNLCQGLDTFSWRVASRNPTNLSGQYVAGAIRFDAGSDGDIEGTVAANAGTAVNYATLTASCAEENFVGKMYSVPDATLNSDMKAVNGHQSREVTLEQTLADELRVQILNLARTNVTEETEDETEDSATAMSTGDTRSGYVRVRSGDALLSVYGTNGPNGYGTLWLVDVVDSAAFTNNAVTLTPEGYGAVEIPCETFPKSTSVYAADRCYAGPAIASSHGYIDTKYTLSNDGGTNAGASSDPTLDVCDLQYFVDTDQEVSYECTDKGGADVGQGSSTITWDDS